MVKYKIRLQDFSTEVNFNTNITYEEWNSLTRSVLVINLFAMMGLDFRVWAREVDKLLDIVNDLEIDTFRITIPLNDDINFTVEKIIDATSN